MKVTKYLPILAVCLMTTGCNSKKEAVLTSGIDLANLDTTAVPGTSFINMRVAVGWKITRWLTNIPVSEHSICCVRTAVNNWNPWLPNLPQRRTMLRKRCSESWRPLQHRNGQCEVEPGGVAPIKDELPLSMRWKTRTKSTHTLPKVRRKVYGLTLRCLSVRMIWTVRWI